MTTSNLSELLKLTPAERIQLAQDLWDSIPEEEPEVLALTEEEYQELNRRLADHERDPSTALAWEDVRARLWKRFGA